MLYLRRNLLTRNSGKYNQYFFVFSPLKFHVWEEVGGSLPTTLKGFLSHTMCPFFFNVFWGGGLRKEQIEEKDDEKAKKKISDENYVLFARK